MTTFREMLEVLASICPAGGSHEVLEADVEFHLTQAYFEKFPNAKERSFVMRLCAKCGLKDTFINVAMRAEVVGNTTRHGANSRRFRCQCGWLHEWARREFALRCPRCNHVHFRDRGGWTA